MNNYKPLISFGFLLTVACGSNVDSAENVSSEYQEWISCPSYDKCEENYQYCEVPISIELESPYRCLSHYFGCMSRAADCTGWPFLGCLYDCDKQDADCDESCWQNGSHSECFAACKTASIVCSNVCNSEGN